MRCGGLEMAEFPSQADHDIAERANVAWGQAINGPHVAVLAAQMARREGFAAGLMAGARTLWKDADDFRAQADESRRVVDAGAYRLAADILHAWGNGLEIQANNPPAGVPA